jgi:hypothetical protein
MPVDVARWRRLPAVEGVAVLLSDSVTVFDAATAAGALLITGSHGGLSALAYVAGHGARAVVVNDAGVGKDGAGIAGLAAVESVGLAAVAVSHASARIGDAEDTLANGVVSHSNELATRAGVRPGMAVRDTLAALASCEVAVRGGHALEVAPVTATLVDRSGPGIHAVDSAAAAGEALAGTLVVTGSHGGATHGRALDVRVAGAAFNDAGIGKDRAGVARLAILEAAGIPGIAVGHDSARIGEALDAWAHGVISVVNGPAAGVGAAVGQHVQTAMRAIAKATGGSR